MAESKKAPSPSRTYIAMCNKGNFEGFYFRKFTLPHMVENSIALATWHFLNRLNFEACLETCFAAEDLGPAAESIEEQR